MTRMYYRGAAACILCYDVTDRTSFDRVRFWAGELKATEQVHSCYCQLTSHYHKMYRPEAGCSKHR